MIFCYTRTDLPPTTSRLPTTSASVTINLEPDPKDVYEWRTLFPLFPLFQPSSHEMHRSSAADSCHTDLNAWSELVFNIELHSMISAEHLPQPLTSKKRSLYVQNAALNQHLEQTGPYTTTQPLPNTLVKNALATQLSTKN